MKVSGEQGRVGPAAMSPALAVVVVALLVTACAGRSPNAHDLTSIAPADAPSADGAASTTHTADHGRHMLSGPAEARNAYAPIMAMLVPGYSFRVLDSGGPPTRYTDQGFVWSVPILIEAANWRHGAAISYAEYLQSGRWTARLVYRLRALSVPADDAIFHIFAGVGGAYDSLGGFAPRAEIDWLIGAMGRGGGLLLTAYEYHPNFRSHVAEIALSFFIPYVIR